MNQENMNPQSFPLSEAMYYSIFENTGTATVIIEQDTTIYLANREFSRLSGFAKDEVEGRKSWKNFCGFSPGSLQNGKDSLPPPNLSSVCPREI
jgi:PAS domain-containing protein